MSFPLIFWVFVTVVIGVSLAPSPDGNGIVNAEAFNYLEARQCSASLKFANKAANRMQQHYYNSSTGQYNNGELWTDVNALEDLHNLMLATGTNDFGTVAEGSYLGKAALNSDTDWNSFIAGSFDDAQWCILALWKIADYKADRQQDFSAYSNAASSIYDIVSNQWDDTTCGGGVWWSSKKTYKNAITNQLFLLTSALGYLRTKNESYFANANKEWAWLSNSGMRNSDGLYNDGLDSTIPGACKNNGMTTWTYNQGVIASGLAALSVVNNDPSLLGQAEITLDATITKLTVNNILKEPCDNTASGGTQCNHDQQSFKGIWTKHLQYYLDAANDTKRISKYSSFLRSQYSAIAINGTDWYDDIGSVWYAANQGGSIFSPQSSASGLACAIAAAKYGQA